MLEITSSRVHRVSLAALRSALLFAIPFGVVRAQTTPSSPAASASPAPTQQLAKATADWPRTHYTKRELHIPMRDGTKLYTAVYTPISSEFDDKGPYPFLITRTPYSCAPYGPNNITPRVTANQNLIRGGYILVCQDVRGRWDSEGTWVEMTPSKDGHGIDESTDTSDTIDYLLKNVPDNNGRVGILGISYPGFYTAASIVDSHPAIKAASPQAPIIDYYMGDDSFHGGAYMLQANHTFYVHYFKQNNPLTVEPKDTFKYPTDDLYTYFLQKGSLSNLVFPAGSIIPYFSDQIAHPDYDSYWQIRNLAPHMHGVKAAVLDVGGWFDAEDLSGPVKVFHAIDKLSPQAPENTLVEGPWVHGGWYRSDGDHLGNISFKQTTAVYFRDHVEAPFFDYYLKDKPWTALPKVVAFETGSDTWHNYTAWPPPDAQPRLLYLQPNRGLAWTPPTATDSKDTYVSDPANPVPYTTNRTSEDVPQPYMDEDQRFAAARSDVLVYQTDPLTEDITVAGPVSPKLHIASTGTDSDFDVKLIDVYPPGYTGSEAVTPDGKPAPASSLDNFQMLVRGEPFRARFRNSFEHPEPLTPNHPTVLNFTMQDVNHTFRKGHRIMIQVQSSWFPLTDRNPQIFIDTNKATPADFHKATETVFHQADAPSAIELLVLPH
ncbi:MAG TPA: CocE/NonD family hydrolase [Acidobacteriaceae bacterium]|nr:CocE/NonD family hydrolase [Acidobacteriaceae bacterium]